MRKKLIHAFSIGSKFSMACAGKGVRGEPMNAITSEKKEEITCAKCLAVINKKVSITLQPEERSNGVLPYPYFIDEQGFVGRQDFWKGEPYRLIAFNSECVQGVGKRMVRFDEFLADPQLAVGMYPVFEHKDKG